MFWGQPHLEVLREHPGWLGVWEYAMVLGIKSRPPSPTPHHLGVSFQLKGCFGLVWFHVSHSLGLTSFWYMEAVP